MNEQKFQKDVNLFMKSKGISSMNLYYANKRLENNMTPYILEERQMNVTQMDVFSRLMQERILWLCGVVDEQMMTISQAQIMYLDSVNNNDITLQISSPGGRIDCGLGIVDVASYVNSDISTVCMSEACSMGSVILGSGVKSKRLILPNAKVMVHQSSAGVQGTYMDSEIEMNEWRKTNDKIFELLGKYCDKDPEQVRKDASRNLWFNAEEAVAYGIVDKIITKKSNK